MEQLLLANLGPSSGRTSETGDSPRNFSPSLVLSRILESGDVGNHLNEFRSLSRETDPELFYEGLYNLGVRLEQSGHGEMAANVYSTLSVARPLSRPSGTLPPEGGGPLIALSPLGRGEGERGRTIPPHIQHQAAARLAALRGEGSVGLRLEVLGRTFARQAMAPAPLIGMGVAGLAFRGVNLFAATRLANLSAGLLTRGPGLRILSSLAGFAAEVPAFTLTGRAVDRLLTGPVGAGLALPEAHGRAPLLQEMVSAALVLGSLKLFGAAFGRAGQALPLPGTRYAVPVQGALQQMGMLTGIMAGHGLEVAFGLRERQAPSLFLAESLVTLAQFNVAGRLSHSVFGERFARLQQSLAMQTAAVGAGSTRPSWQGNRGTILSRMVAEGRLTLPLRVRVSEYLQNMADSLGPRFATEVPPSKLLAGKHPAFGHSLPEGEGQGEGPPSPLTQMQSFMVRHEGGEGGSSGTEIVPLPKMGIRTRIPGGLHDARVVRERTDRVLRDLMPLGRIFPDRVQDRSYVAGLLQCFGVTSHPFDQSSFQKGFEIAQKFPERIERMAWDIDEVYLHWSLSLPDLFRGIFERGADALFHSTAPDLFQYEPFSVAPQVKLHWYERIWFNGIQALFQGRMRQHLQLHPGVRAFQLGLRLGQEKNLIMATTGPAGRILILANEDPAMRMIYFGKLPDESVSIEEVRRAANIYTREHLVQAMREIIQGEIQYPHDPLVRSYIESIQRHPKKGVKLKHPAIARLLAKRPFDVLVDDSASTYQMLGDLPHFAVLRPPSARPGLTLNFVLGSTNRYLKRMANAYVESLAEVLGWEGDLHSQMLLEGPSIPSNYPFQRFAIEIPWHRFGREFVAPARELRFRGEQIQGLLLPDLPLPPPTTVSEDFPWISGAVSFPYLKQANDPDVLPPQPYTVAVLGDVGGCRAYQLASRGHQVVFIDQSEDEIIQTRSLVSDFARLAQSMGDPFPDLGITFLQGDWYKTSLKQDVVEAFFPLHLADVPRTGDPMRVPAFEDFLRRALDSKLKAGGFGFVISEFEEIIRDLAEVIRQDPQHELLEENYYQHEIPVIGGYSIMRGRAEKDHWLVYRLKSNPVATPSISPPSDISH